MARVLAAFALFSVPVHASAGAIAHSDDAVQYALDDGDSCADEASISLLQKQAEAVHSGAIQRQEPEAAEEEIERHVAGEDGSLVPHIVTTSTSPPKVDPTLKCIQNTGGSCPSNVQCADWRGPTVCSRSRCYCRAGYCATVEGKCVPQSDQQVLHNFTLRNARYPDQYLYISAYQRKVMVSSRVDDEMSFDLFMPPGQDDNRTGGSTEFFLGSETYDMWVAAVGKSSDCVGNGKETTCTQRATVDAVAVKKFSASDILGMALNIYLAPEYDQEPNDWQNQTQSVMIESYRYPRHFFSLSSLSWGVQATYGDGGAGSYWIPEPPIPVPLKAYVGPRCAWDCGFYGSGASPVLAPMIIGGSSFLCCLVCCGCWCAAPRRKSTEA